MWRQHSGSLQSESFQTFTYFTFFNLSCYAETNSKKKFKFKSTPTPDWQRESSNLNISEKKFWNIALRHSDCTQLNNYSLHPHDSDDSSFVPACGDILTLFLSNCWWGACLGELSGFTPWRWLAHLRIFTVAPKPLLCCLGRVLQVIVLLEDGPLAPFEVLSPLD